MLRILSLTFIGILLTGRSFGYEITYTSQNNYTGNWNTLATWTYSPIDGTGEPVQPGNPTNSSAVAINVYGYITVSSSLSVTNANPTLTIYDTLYVNGDLTLGSGADMVVEAGGVLVVTGTLTIEGSFNLNNTGRIVVGENFNITNGSVTNSNNIYVYGTTTASGGGTVNGCNPYGGCSPYATIKDDNDLEAEDSSLFDFVESGGLLPIELGAFTVRPLTHGVELQWTTLSEINNDYFTLQRSANGVDYENIATVDGAGNSLEKLSYSFVDDSPLLGRSYYRLKQTDFDGTSEIFYPVFVDITTLESGELNFTNPVKIGSSVSLYTSAEDSEVLTLSVYNMVGGEIFNRQFSGSTFEFRIDDSVKPGVYFVKISSVLSEQTGRLVIQ